MDENDFRTVRIETPRLRLLPADLKYAEAIFRNFTSRITKYMHPKPAERREETMQFLESSLEDMSEGRNLQLIIVDKADEFVGCVGLHNLDTPRPELGIWIQEKMFGKGYGFEAVRAVANWAVKKGRWKVAQYPVDQRNSASRRIPERLNGRVVREYRSTNLSGFELDQREYEIPLDKEFDL